MTLSSASAEAELAALSKLAMELSGIRSMAAEWKIVEEGITCQLYTDASAASIIIAKRQEAGKIRQKK